ncbi:MAG: threonine aldolase family protein [Fimbriimonadaceae bacterium]
MSISDAERTEIYGGCTRFLGHRPPRPVAERLREMAESEYAKKPQDFYGRGGVVSDVESEVAEMMGKEAAAFMPSGTMAQQIALRLWCEGAASQTVAFHPTSHLEIHEHGAYRELHHLSAVLLGEKQRLFTLDDLVSVTERLGALLIELPQREIGGQLPTWEELGLITTWAKGCGVKLHLDGARLWECGPYYGRPYAEIVGGFDSVYVSCYKVLGGLPGAILCGPAEFIADARIWQRRHGGNLHSLAPNAIAAKIGMEKHLPQIPDYCRKAAELSDALRGIDRLTVVPDRPPTNMMHWHFNGDLEQIENAAWEVARDTRLFLFGRMDKVYGSGVGVVEQSIGEAALELDAAEIRTLMLRILA